jgi:hypothetical protein
VNLVDAQRAPEALQDLPPVVGQVQAADGVAQAVVDEAAGELQEEVAAQDVEGGLDVEAAVEDVLQDGVADLVVVGVLGEDLLGVGAEALLAAAAGGIDLIGFKLCQRFPVAFPRGF